MKKTILLSFLLCLAFLLPGCEKDDICDEATSTTPRLIIDFYDINNPTLKKNVTKLALINDLPDLDTLKFDAESKIQVPLRVLENSAKYRFILNFGNANPALVYTDVMEFNYTRETLFVSRACGYKTLFDLNTDLSLPDAWILNNDTTQNSGVWIKSVVVEKYNLESENETHLKIYF